MASNFRATVLLSPISLPIARTLALARLPAYFPIILASFLSFQLLEWVSPLCLARISPKHFGGASARLKQNWTTRVVSMAHALIIIPLAFLCLDLPELDRDRAFGFDSGVGGLAAIACGYGLVSFCASNTIYAYCNPYSSRVVATSYFLWDALNSIVHFTGLGFVIHGFACLVVFGLSFRPFLGYFVPRFLLWELSTPFLNIHWFLEKTNKTSGYLQLINGIVLLVTFFLARIFYGGLMSLQFFGTLRDVQTEIPTAMAAAYALGNVALQALNWFWFYKMLLTLSRRLSEGPPGHLAKNGGASPNNGENGKLKIG